MQNKQIQEFEKGETIQGFFLVKSYSVKTTANNKKYADYILGDKTGEINAKWWGYKEDGEEFPENILVKVRGTVTEWQNQMQLRIDLIRKVSDDDNVNIEDFVASAPVEPEEMLGFILKFVIGIKDMPLKEMVSYIINENREKLMYYPAAQKNHHAVRGGLLYHISTMLTIAEKLMEVYPFLNKDLLYSGIILHDILKLEEMEANELGVVSDYTMEGKLLGHIIQGIKMVDRIGEKMGVDNETIVLLEHMILSHHYEPEYGSPKRPMIPEAEMLHYIDMIDARMYDMKKALDTTQGGEFSERIWSLEKRQLYKLV